MIYLGFPEIRRQGLEFLWTASPTTIKPPSMVEPRTTAFYTRSLELLNSSSSCIALIPALESVLTKHPWKRVWEETWLTGIRILSSSRRLRINVKVHLNYLRNRKIYFTVCIHAPTPKGNSIISRISDRRWQINMNPLVAISIAVILTPTSLLIVIYIQ